MAEGGFPKIRSTLIAGHKVYSILGFILGPSSLGNYHVESESVEIWAGKTHGLVSGLTVCHAPWQHRWI